MTPVLYQDRDLAVCKKRPGQLSQDGPGETLPGQLRRELGCEIYPVHRLDREAGGLMVYGKTRQAAGALSKALAGGEFEKEYLCLVLGRPEEAAGSYRDLLLHDRARNKSFVVHRTRGGVREARLDYWLVAAAEGLSLVRVRLHTGRTHQIRVQFASRVTPLAGDGKYGGGGGALALWSWRLAFPHPRGRRMDFRLPPEGAAWERFAPALEELKEEEDVCR